VGTTYAMMGLGDDGSADFSRAACARCTPLLFGSEILPDASQLAALGSELGSLLEAGPGAVL